MVVVCEICGCKAAAYSDVHCRCGDFLGFPNYRAALAERQDLAARDASARADAQARGVAPLLRELERLASAALPVIAMSVQVCDDLLRKAKYRNYSQRIQIGDGDLWPEPDHASRMKVNEQLFPNYGQHIVFAALAPVGEGLDSYGEVAVTWNVTPYYLGRRATLLEENSYPFYERFGLGALGAVTPKGYRATWDDRVPLAVAKLAERLTPSMSKTALPALLIRAGANKMTDIYIEVNIYADAAGMDGVDIAAVKALRVFSDEETRDAWERISVRCVERNIRTTDHAGA